MSYESVCCANCQRFTRDTIGFGDGIGACEIYEKFKDDPKWSARVQVELGMRSGQMNAVLWPNVERICTRYTPSGVDHQAS